MQEQDCDTAPARWARETGPDVPQSARRILIYLAENCRAETGVGRVSYRTIAGHFGYSLRWAQANIEELRLAGLVSGGVSTDGDKRVNAYTLAGAESGWTVTTPFVRYNRREFYRHYLRVAELERLLQATSHGTVPCDRH